MTDKTLNLPGNSLVVFVDDTGHEALAKGHDVYGLGGCAVMAFNIDKFIRNPWRNVRKLITGSPETPLHAATFSQTATKEHIKIIADFFSTPTFARFGATVSIQTKFANELDKVPTIAMVLQQRIIDIANWTAFEDLRVIFESSERANKLIQSAMSNFKISENGKEIPVECYFMPKSAGDPAMEVADFVMHAVGRQVRYKLSGKKGFVPDFKAVFHTVGPRLASYMEVEKIVAN